MPHRCSTCHRGQTVYEWRSLREPTWTLSGLATWQPKTSGQDDGRFVCSVYVLIDEKCLKYLVPSFHDICVLKCVHKSYKIVLYKITCHLRVIQCPVSEGNNQIIAMPYLKQRADLYWYTCTFDLMINVMSVISCICCYHTGFSMGDHLHVGKSRRRCL